MAPLQFMRYLVLLAALTVYSSFTGSQGVENKTDSSLDTVNIQVAIPVGMHDYPNGKSWIPHLIEHLFVRELLELCFDIDCYGSVRGVTEENFTLISIDTEPAYAADLTNKIQDIFESGLASSVQDVGFEVGSINIEIENKLSASDWYLIKSTELSSKRCHIVDEVPECISVKKRTHKIPETPSSIIEAHSLINSEWEKRYRDSGVTLLVVKNGEKTSVTTTARLREEVISEARDYSSVEIVDKNLFTINFPLEGVSPEKARSIQGALSEYIKEKIPDINIEGRFFAAYGSSCYSKRLSSCLSFSSVYDGSEGHLSELKKVIYKALSEISKDDASRIYNYTDPLEFGGKPEKFFAIRNLLFSNQSEFESRDKFVAELLRFSKSVSDIEASVVEILESKKIVIPVEKNYKSKGGRKIGAGVGLYSSFIPRKNTGIQLDRKQRDMLYFYIKKRCGDSYKNYFEVSNRGILLTKLSKKRELPRCYVELKNDRFGHLDIVLAFAEGGVNYDINTSLTKKIKNIISYIKKEGGSFVPFLSAREFVGKDDFGVAKKDYEALRAYVNSLDFSEGGVTFLRELESDSLGDYFSKNLSNRKDLKSHVDGICSRNRPNYASYPDDTWLYGRPNNNSDSAGVMLGFIASEDYGLWLDSKGRGLKFYSLLKDFRRSSGLPSYDVRWFTDYAEEARFYYVVAQVKRKDILKAADYLKGFLENKVGLLSACRNESFCSEKSYKKYITYTENTLSELKDHGVKNPLHFIDLHESFDLSSVNACLESQ